MDYELKKYKRDKSSIIPIEEVYTDLDIKENDPYDPSVGFRFDTPRRWAQDKSKSKSVGIRDLKLTPSSGDIRCRFVVYGHIGYTTTHYTWVAGSGSVAAHYEKGAETFRELDTPAKFYAVSNAINYSVIPSTKFEDVASHIQTQLNLSKWKEIEIQTFECSTKGKKTHINNRGPFYAKLVENSTDDSTDLTTLDYVENQNFLKLPLTFSYHFDANTGDFQIKSTDYLRVVKMDNRSKPSRTEDDYYPHYDVSDIPSAHQTYLTTDINNHPTTQKTSGSTPVAELDAYNPSPKIKASELLMIIDGTELESLKAVYSFFNKKLNDKDIDDLALISLDGKDYYVPFIKNLGGDSSFNFIDGQERAYTSAFPFSTTNRYTDFHAASTTLSGVHNNLDLRNVWDRIHLIYHATFAETRMRIIGRNGDHWDSPNKRFIVPGGDQDEFYLRFSTDGKHNILPIGCHFNVDLCFMLNTTNNTATGNHDSFK